MQEDGLQPAGLTTASRDNVGSDAECPRRLVPTPIIAIGITVDTCADGETRSHPNVPVEYHGHASHRTPLRLRVAHVMAVL